MSEHHHRSSRQPPALLEGRPVVGQQPVALGPRPAILELQRSTGNAAVRDLLARSARPDTARPDTARRDTARRDNAGPDTADRQVQRFGGREHRNIGDWATNPKYVTLGSKGYQLSYGEMIALAGDLFPSLAYTEKLADRPGPGPQTQEALDYARFIKIGRRDSGDARTRSQQVEDDASGGFPGDERRYNPANYSKATVKAVDAMSSWPPTTPATSPHRWARTPPRNPGSDRIRRVQTTGKTTRRRCAGHVGPANGASPPCRRRPPNPSAATSSPMRYLLVTCARPGWTSSRTGTSSTPVCSPGSRAS